MIYIVTPSKLDHKTVTGNHQTGLRYLDVLKVLGVNSILMAGDINSDQLKNVDGMILLHAKKSHSTATLCKEKLIPYALVLTGTDLYLDMLNKDSSAYQKCIDSICGAKVIIVLQPHAKQLLLKILPDFKTKIFVIFQSTSFGPQSIANNRIKKDISIVMVGNIRKEKDTLTGINGFIESKKKCDGFTNSKVTLTHIGMNMDVQYSYLVKNYVAKNKNNINFLGLQTNSDTIKIMKNCDLLLNPSVIEGGCLVVKEAIDLNLAVLASDIPCHREMLGENYPGLFLQQNVIELSKKLQKFILEKETRSLWKKFLLNSPIALYKLKDEIKLVKEAVNFLK